MRRALELVEQALELAGAEGRSPFLLMNRARFLEYHGRLDEAEAGYREAEKLAAERGTVPALVAAYLGRASVELFRGHLDDARAKLAHADEAMATLSPTHPQRITRLLIEGRIALATGDYSAAQAAFEQALRRRRSRRRPLSRSLGWPKSRLLAASPARRWNWPPARAQAARCRAASRVFPHRDRGRNVRARTGADGQIRGCTARCGRMRWRNSALQWIHRIQM